MRELGAEEEVEAFGQLTSSCRATDTTPAPRSACQCRKWRTPVKTIASLRSSAAAMTSASRTEPPG